VKPIIQLDQPLINKISAGEVVERPLSVVKELIENAIDAGASAITVEITDGGLTSIRVTDNGAGIPAGQILLAFARHATSKIASIDDLFEVGTLGFRGEALSSIAAVSQVEMITKTAGAITGVRVEIHGGELVSQREIGAANGTTLVVNNLFFNTPARRKFLKKPGTEAGYIADCLQKLALGNPGLTIRYINNGEIVFQTNGRGDLKTAMLNIYGREVASKLINVAAELEGMELTGQIAKPELARGNRQRQSFFINGRLIQSKLLTQAVEEAAKTMLSSGKFPVYALNLNLAHESVDVNVHPTKMDVRFADEEAVFRFVRGAVREALTESNLIPEMRITERKSVYAPLDQITLPKEVSENARPLSGINEIITQPISDARNASSTKVSDKLLARHINPGLNPSSGSEQQPASPHLPSTPRHSNAAGEEGIQGRQQAQQLNAAGGEGIPDRQQTQQFTVTAHQSSQDNAHNNPSPLSLREESPREHQSFFTNYRVLGLIFGTYWLITQGESLYLIDQHAAHERVLYEEILEKTAAGAINSQRLVAPIPLRLTPREASLLKENLPLFTRFGFEITPQKDSAPHNPAEITAVPTLFKGPVNTEFFTNLLDKISEIGFQGSGVYAHKTEAIAMAACKASVKAGDYLSEAEARGLIEKMLSLENPFTCPHGRPTIIEITKGELTRRFKRG